MKLYIWETDTLTDHYDGMIVVLAKSLKSAQKSARLAVGPIARFPDMPDHVIDPATRKTPFVAIIYGGS